MSAQIRIESGISAGASYGIDRPVLRIGSDPQCELCIPAPEVPAHALTLEHRAGSYRIYNRAPLPILVAGVPIQPSTSAPWREGQSLELPGDVRLALELNGDAALMPDVSGNGALAAGAVDAVESAPPDDTQGKPASQSMKMWVQIAIIALCVAAGALLLLAPKGGESASADRPTLEALVAASLEADGLVRTLLPKLQYAEDAVVRGHPQLARERFGKLRDQLIRQPDSLNAKERHQVDQMLRYVEYRLGAH